MSDTPPNQNAPTITREQWQGLARALCAILAGTALHYGFTQDIWGLFVGALLLGINVVWSIRTHGLTLDLLSSFLRAAIGAGGAYAVNRGWTTSDNVTALVGLITAVAPIAWTTMVTHAPNK